MKKATIGIMGNLVIASTLWALPPTDQGYTWECLEELSDEFKATTLDSQKWVDYHLWWKGRVPCMFAGENVSVSAGTLRLKTTTDASSIPADALTNTNWMTGACISSINAFPMGYTEASIRGSALKTIHGYWLQGTYSEVDIEEDFGHPDNPLSGLLRMNTHHFVDNWAKSKDDPGSVNVANPTGQYHVYGAWFNSKNSVKFYLDGTEAYESNNPGVDNAGVDFREPMHMFLNTESFAASSWISSVDEYLDSIADLKDNTKNTMYCDWVRSYWQIPVDGHLVRDHGFETTGLPDWGCWGSGCSVSQISSDSKTGTYAVQVNGYGGAVQEIMVQPNVNYELSAWVKASPTSPALLWISDAETGNKIERSVISSTNWTFSSIVFKTGNTNMFINVSLVNSGSNGSAKFDLVRLVPSDYRVWNRGFESGTLSPFWLSTGTVSLSDYDVRPWAPYSGKYAVTLQSSPAGIRQIINVNPNTTYRLSSRILAGNSNYGGAVDYVYLGVKNYGGTEKFVRAQTETYDEYSVEFSTGLDSYTAEIYLWKPTQEGSDTSSADGFKVVEVLNQ